MIHTIRTVTVDSKKSVIDSPIVLYRGDREVEIEFSLVGSTFTFSEGGNVIKSLNAAYGQLIIHSPNPNIDIVFSEITECNDGKVVFLITKEMIDELVEVGTYDFQIRLYDATQVSRATIPPISQALDIRHPIGSEEETNVVDIAIAEYSVVRDDPFEEVMTFLPNGDYNKTEWSSNALITAARMNKIEDGLYTVNRNMEVSDTSLFNRIEKVNNNLSARLNNLGDEIATEAMDSFSDQIAQLKGTVNASILASETKVTAEMDATKESVNAELEAFEETVNAELELTRNTVEETKAAIDEAKVTVDETQSVVTELIDETRETVSSFEGRINNLDAAYKAADVEIQNEIQNEINELQNNIPINVSQLINDMNYVTEDYLAGYNLLSNTIFPNKDIYFWNLWSNMRVIESNDPYYYGREGTLCIKSDVIYSDEIQSGILVKIGRGTFYHNQIRVEPETAYTFSFYCKWEENIAGCDYFIEYYDESMEIIEDTTQVLDMKELENDFNKRQSITFTTPQNAYYVICGFGHDGVITADIGNNAIFINKPAIKKGTSDVWSPESFDVNPGSSWGHYALPGGLLLQWGVAQIFYSQSGSTTGETYVSYPIKYSTFSRSYVNLQGVNADVSVESTNYILASHSSPDGVSIRFRDYRDNMAFAHPNNVVVNWFAIGK